MKLLIDVKESRASALLSLLKSLGSDVNVKTVDASEYLFLTEFKEAIDDLNLVKAGKKKARDAYEFLDEL